MTLLARCISYVVIVSVVSLGFALGAVWLLRPDASAARAAHTPPLPPRIADSIERKKDPPAPPAPAIAAGPALPETRQDANAALHPLPPRQVIRELKVQRPARPRREPVQEARNAQMQASTSFPQPAGVTTARSDVPY
jgi:hypothetical protein